MHDILLSGVKLVIDGGLATEVERQGGDISGSLWSAKALIEQPDLIRDTHKAYFDAGANVCIVSSYQLSKANLYNFDPTLNFEDLIHRSVKLAREARAASVRKSSDIMLVAGSVGPYGAVLANGSEYTGDYGDCTIQDLVDFHMERIQLLCKYGVDMLACETIPSMSEVKALFRLLRAPPAGDMPCWVTFTLRDAGHISDGTPLETVCKHLDGVRNIIALGINCVEPNIVVPALKKMREATSKSLVVYPNSGEKWNAVARQWEGDSMADAGVLPDRVNEWAKAGADMIGGCCRTGPKETAIISSVIGDLNRIGS